MLGMINDDQQLLNPREACTRSELFLSEYVNDVSTESSKASSVCDDDEEAVKRGPKREHAAIAATAHADTKLSIVSQCTSGDIEEKTSVDLKEDESVDESTATKETEDDDEGPPRKLSRLAEDVFKKPATVPSNQVVVNAFSDYGDQELHRGQTGQGVTHLRAARSIRDYPSAITSSIEARDVPLVGAKMATQIEQILSSSKVENKAVWSEEDNLEVNTLSRLVRELRTITAKRPENQPVVDELAKRGEHELYLHSSSKGTSHLRAGRELQLADRVITSGDNARQEVAYVGPAIANEIGQTKNSCIVKDTPLPTEAIRTAKDVGENATQQPENQLIVDASVDFGDCHSLKGAAFLRAAKVIRDAEIVVTSGKQAAESIKAVDHHVIAKIDHILKHEHDTTENGGVEEGSDFGDRECPDTPPIQEAHSKPAQIDGNQNINDALSAHGETETATSTGQGTVFSRAAHRLHDAAEIVTSSSVGKALGCIGDMVTTFVNTTESADDSTTDDEEGEKN